MTDPYQEQHCKRPIRTKKVSPYVFTTQGDDTLPDRAPSPAQTTPLDRRPITLAASRQGEIILEPDAPVVIQFLPSGQCVSLALKRPVIMGRNLPQESPPYDTLDLNCHNAFDHGVSRRHCMLFRQDRQLFVTDLGSTNGTYINDRSLTPQQDYILAHGDKLIMGTLHMVVAFGVAE